MMSEEIGIIEYDKLETATYLMYNNTALTTVQCDFPVLTDGRSMFEGCTALETFTSELNKLNLGNCMFRYCSGLKTFDVELPNLSDGSYMFYKCTALTEFKHDLPNLTRGGWEDDAVSGMFGCCTSLETFQGKLDKLLIGDYMFMHCDNLTTFTSDLSSLKDGDLMFYYCSKLTSFNADLPSLTDGDGMFYRCSALTSFTSDLSSLTNGSYMFNDCLNLTTFASDLPSLTNGYEMFEGCTELSSFEGDLSSLTKGELMFSGCKLNAESIQYIADNINDLKSKNKTGVIHIGHDGTVSQEVLQYCGNKLIDKGWTVYFNDTLYKYATPYDVSEANGWCPNAWKSYYDNWNRVVLTPKMNELKISIVNEKGEMLNDE